MIPIFVISLTRSEDRRQHIINEFAKQNIPFRFFNAFDGKKIGLSTTIPYLYDHNDWASKGQGDRPDFFIGPGVNALALSHVALAKYIIMMDLPEALIMEDDVILEDNFLEKLEKTKSALPSDYNYLYCQYCCEHQKKCIKEDYNLWKAHCLCTACLLVSNKGSRLLDEKFTMGEPIDCFLYHFCMDPDGMYCCGKPLAGQKSITGEFATTLS